MKGRAYFERGWEATEDEFQRNLDRVKEALDELSDEEIMRDEDLARHAFHQVGAYDGPSVFLYDEHGSAIRHRGQLDRILEESEELDRARRRPLLTTTPDSQQVAREPPAHTQTQVPEYWDRSTSGSTP